MTKEQIIMMDVDEFLVLINERVRLLHKHYTPQLESEIQAMIKDYQDNHYGDFWQIEYADLHNVEGNKIGFCIGDESHYYDQMGNIEKFYELDDIFSGLDY